MRNQQLLTVLPFGGGGGDDARFAIRTAHRRILLLEILTTRLSSVFLSDFVLYLGYGLCGPFRSQFYLVQYACGILLKISRWDDHLRAPPTHGLFLLTEIRAYWPRHVAHIHPQTACNIIEECAAKQFSKALAIRFD